ncbi:hypothetical protein B0H13DRAFT_1884181 [Mycena leptocephala]|nr:hypothetical protein B0H13DRAFT_1884181 [Mycena leptocephala]
MPLAAVISDAEESDPKRVRQASPGSEGTIDSNDHASSANVTDTGLGTPEAVDPTQSTHPTHIDNSADLHRLILPDAYNRIATYEMVMGADFKLDNLAIADPGNYELQASPNPVVFRKGGEHPIRFFILGCVTARSALHFRMVNGRRSINVMPSALSWRRATGVINSIFGSIHLEAYVFSEIPTSASPKKQGPTTPARGKIPVATKSGNSDKGGNIHWEPGTVLSPDKPGIVEKVGITAGHAAFNIHTTITRREGHGFGSTRRVCGSAWLETIYWSQNLHAKSLNCSATPIYVPPLPLNWLTLQRLGTWMVRELSRLGSIIALPSGQSGLYIFKRMTLFK